MTVDWSKPIEAVHEDGRVFAMKVVQLNAGATGRNDHWLATLNGSRFPGVPGSHTFEWAHRDGDLPGQPGWRIRNVQPAAAKPTISDELVERLQDFARMVAGGSYLHAVNESGWSSSDIVAKANQLVAELPQPVDPDLLEARKLLVEVRGNETGKRYNEDVLAGKNDTDENAGINIEVLAEAIKRGRALERGEP